MKKLVLFDMDGTLTPARSKMTWNVIDALSDLQKNNFEIGIVTGSDLDYIKQQCDLIFDLSPVDCFNIHYLPCNGTKYYKMTANNFKCVYENNMRSKVGEKNWRNLIRVISGLQSTLVNNYDIPLTGNFLNYRGSTLNWCPIGRNANSGDRTAWCEIDDEKKIRSTWLSIARQALNNIGLNDIIIKFGGDTSFDIYPNGWDKTYAWKNFKDYDRIYFVGDRCDENGNDREAYLLSGKHGYSTDGPENTIQIIKKIIEQEAKNG